MRCCFCCGACAVLLADGSRWHATGLWERSEVARTALWVCDSMWSEMHIMGLLCCVRACVLMSCLLAQTLFVLHTVHHEQQYMN